EHSARSDGEIVVLDDQGVPQFSDLQTYKPESTKGTLICYVFDLLHLNGHDTIELTLLESTELLKGLLPDSAHIQFCDHVSAMGITVYEKAVGMGMEGVMAKKSNSTYDPNIRTSNWLKFKKIEDTEAIICGYTLSKTKSRKFSSLILGM